MDNSVDFNARGWSVVTLGGGDTPSPEVMDVINSSPEAPGRSSDGTRNLLYTLILCLKPRLVLEIGSHIGTGSVWIGAALKANKFGKAYCLEPQQHYYDLHVKHLALAGVSNETKTLPFFSTDENLQRFITEKVDLVFLDANHSYSAALKDLHIAHELLSDRGVIILDDTGEGHSADIDEEGAGGVRQALIDFCAIYPEYSMTFFDNPFWLNPCGLAMAVRHKGVDLRTTAERNKINDEMISISSE